MSTMRVATVTVPTAGPTVSSTLDLAPNEVVVSIEKSSTFDGTALTITGNSTGHATTMVPVLDHLNTACAITMTTNTAAVHLVPYEATLGLVKVCFTSGSAQAAGGGETLRVTIRTI